MGDTNVRKTRSTRTSGAIRTPSKRSRPSQDDSIAQMRQRLENVMNPTEKFTPRTLIRNVLGTDNADSSFVSKADSPSKLKPQRLVRKSKTPEMNSARKLSAASDAADSFVLPRHRAGRRRIHEKERRKPTKADVEEFAAGVEAMIADGAFVSSTNSETEISFAKEKPTLEVNASARMLQENHDADSFVLPAYRAGRRRLGKRTQRRPTKADVEAFAAGVEQMLTDGVGLSESESGTNVSFVTQNLPLAVGESAIALQESYDADSFVLPAHRAGRRRIGKRERRKPTKADVESFAAGIEHMLAAGVDLSGSESEIDDLGVKHKLASEMVVEENVPRARYDTFAQPMNTAGGKVLKKKGLDKMLTATKAVDVVNDDDWLTTDESSDSQSKPPHKLQNDLTPKNLLPAKRSARKRLSQDANMVIETSHTRKLHSYHLEGEYGITQPGDLDISGSSSKVKLSLSKKTVDPRGSRGTSMSESFGAPTTSKDIAVSPNHVTTSPGKRNSSDARKKSIASRDVVKVPKRNLRRFGSSILKEAIDSPRDYENHGFSPKLSSTRVSPRLSLPLQEKFSVTPSRSNVSSTQENDLANSHASSKRYTELYGANRTSLHSRRSDPVHEQIEVATEQVDQSVRSKLNSVNSSMRNSMQSQEKVGWIQKSPQPSGSSVMSTRSSHVNESKSAHHVSNITKSPRRSFSFLDDFYVKPALSSSKYALSAGVDDTSIRSKRSTSIHEQIEVATEQVDQSVRSKLNSVNSSMRNSLKSPEKVDWIQQSPQPAGSSVMSTHSSHVNTSKSAHHVSNLMKGPRRSFSFLDDFIVKPASSSSKYALSPGVDNTSIRSNRSPSVQEQIGEAMEGHSKLNVVNLSRTNSAQSHNIVETPPHSGASQVLPTPSSFKNKSTSSHHASPLTINSTRSISVREQVSAKSVSDVTSDSKRPRIRESELEEDLLSLPRSNRSSRYTTPTKADHTGRRSLQSKFVPEQLEEAKQVNLSVRRNLNLDTSVREKAPVGSHESDNIPQKTPTPSDAYMDLPTQSSKNKSRSFQDNTLPGSRRTSKSRAKQDFNKSSRKSLTQSRLVFSPKNSKKLRYSAKASLSRPSLDNNLYSDDSDLGSENKKTSKSQSTQAASSSQAKKPSDVAKNSTSLRDDSDSDSSRQEDGFQSRERSSQSASEGDSNSAKTNKKVKVAPKTKKAAKARGGPGASGKAIDEEFVPFSATKTNFEHFLQKRILRPTAIEVQKQANRFFKMTQVELEKILARKPANKKYISPNEAKQMFIKQGLFTSLDELEMNARQWLDSDAQELVIDYQGAFRNIKYD